jgi:hypothetical protein
MLAQQRIVTAFFSIHARSATSRYHNSASRSFPHAGQLPQNPDPALNTAQPERLKNANFYLMELSFASTGQSVDSLVANGI